MTHDDYEDLAQQAYELIWALRPHRVKGARYERAYQCAWKRYDRRGQALADYEQMRLGNSIELRAYEG